DISGLSIRYDLGPGLGHRAPDRDLPDGTRLADHARAGHGLLLDATPDHRCAGLATGWFTRIRYLATDPTELDASAMLIRPDGHVVANTADPRAMTDALTAWFGQGTDGV
ncbi:aromatic-ring hydroxylase C-terminal domain-containing protein, partial [Nocardia gipuzkoensis]